METSLLTWREEEAEGRLWKLCHGNKPLRHKSTWASSHLTSSHKHYANLMCVVRRHLVQNLHSPVNHLPQRETELSNNTGRDTGAELRTCGIAVNWPEFWEAGAACWLHSQRKESGTAGGRQSWRRQGDSGWHWVGGQNMTESCALSVYCV